MQKTPIAPGQLGLYDSSGAAASLLKGESSSDDIYDLIGYCNSLSPEELISLTGAESASVQSYADYLDDPDILDAIVSLYRQFISPAIAECHLNTAKSRQVAAFLLGDFTVRLQKS